MYSINYKYTRYIYWKQELPDIEKKTTFFDDLRKLCRYSQLI